MRMLPLRLAIAATGLFLLAIGLSALADPSGTGAKLGLAGVGSLGLATLRADLGAFFCGGGGFAIAAAVRRAPLLLTAPTLLIAMALAGRFLALALTPFNTAMIPPMVAEAVMLAIFAAGRLAPAA
jgi:hypothetical protein